MLLEGRLLRSGTAAGAHTLHSAAHQRNESTESGHSAMKSASEHSECEQGWESTGCKQNWYRQQWSQWRKPCAHTCTTDKSISELSLTVTSSNVSICLAMSNIFCCSSALGTDEAFMGFPSASFWVLFNCHADRFSVIRRRILITFNHNTL